MTRPLLVVDSSDAVAVAHALRDALTADGPAVFPYDGVPANVPETVEQRVAVVVETSGSTARPKRVALGADALLASAAAAESALGGPGDWALALPLHYIAGINVVVRAIASQSDFRVDEHGFDAHRFVSQLRGVAYTSLVPAQLARLVELEEIDPLLRLDRILIGGQAMPASLAARALELGLNITRTYGSSETSGGCVWDGVPIGNTDARLIDGRIELSGSVLAHGYLDDPVRTAAAFVEHDGKRWYRTDDTGSITDGVLTVTGRIDDVIVSGGVKVSLAEVEAAVRGMPGLSGAVVVAAPHAEWGETPVVVTEVAVSLDDVREVVGRALGRTAAPTRVVVVPGIPVLSSGKPDRLSIASIVRQ
ncbi:MAG: AMP-binding protein [Actinobacteria bacterium]|nr:AMP-binding protein [Actinomycetota bacterium]